MGSSCCVNLINPFIDEVESSIVWRKDDISELNLSISSITTVVTELYVEEFNFNIPGPGSVKLVFVENP